MIRIIGFDADDTLWRNEDIFEQAHERYRALLAKYHPRAEVDRVLFATEMKNLGLYGYGVKGYTLSCVETAITLTRGQVTAGEIEEILATGREMLAHPVELLAGVAAVVPALARDYRLLLITKGDLHHQERKVAASGLAAHFHAIEILSEKDGPAYERVLRRHGVALDEFAMVGNSLKSDILPVLQLGGAGVHVPYHVTWQHEHVEIDPAALPRFRQITSLADLPAVLPQL
ncbi:haloacid dehalogenase-like hydrolase [Lacunisphaera limnophila]|uniref:Haloacid dehalogenase-like hydrolase n=1 Tax=Lacunisphaera limnophila TaxID=1838286 RepID=A0A1D8AR70_9BACT|nr:HAD family hydrolase [Lacunisphaera limnophila]AOS43378.1 haloacid dehalogenase-like hydrolase [Lacunisphaera limnophila]